jgi:hypothetical protein
MVAISAAQVAKLPYVQERPIDGRSVVLHAFYEEDSREWSLFLPVAPNELSRVMGGEPVSGVYFARVPAKPELDLEVVLGTLITQHLSFPTVLPRVSRIIGDIQRFSISMEKYRMIADGRHGSVETSLLVASELEYLIMRVRQSTIWCRSSRNKYLSL